MILFKMFFHPIEFSPQMCAVAYKTAKDVQPPTIPVYHCSSGLENPLLWRDFGTTTGEASKKYTYENILLWVTTGFWSILLSTCRKERLLYKKGHMMWPRSLQFSFQLDPFIASSTVSIDLSYVSVISIVSSNKEEATIIRHNRSFTNWFWQ